MAQRKRQTKGGVPQEASEEIKGSNGKKKKKKKKSGGRKVKGGGGRHATR